ncbi:MAG: hypothetical protein M1826_007229 [Phylliscum demangeonii]|nr:MAG: hypothetical protein M1826_007229 [Phylliscum demangeonii]
MSTGASGNSSSSGGGTSHHAPAAGSLPSSAGALSSPSSSSSTTTTTTTATATTPSRTGSSALVEATAGFSSGVISTLVCHPLDVIKTRLQVDRSPTAAQFGNSLAIARRIVRLEGGGGSSGGSGSDRYGRYGQAVRALYRGLWPNLVGNSISWSCYFVCYDYFKAQLCTMRAASSSTSSSSSLLLSTSDYLLASAVAGALTSAATNPIWVIKTRMLSTGADARGAYRGLGHGWRTIVRGPEGVRGLYRGLVPSLVGVSHGAIQFAVYEALKNWERGRSRRQSRGRRRGRSRHNDDAADDDDDDHRSTKPSNRSTLLFSAVSKSVAGAITYPCQLVRTRLQSYDAATGGGGVYAGLKDVVRQSWRREGVRAFYKGLVPSLVRVLPTTCITFLTYENCRFYLPSLLRQLSRLPPPPPSSRADGEAV